MDVKRGRMVFLGYGKYWRSDRILGLTPIEQGRGPGREKLHAQQGFPTKAGKQLVLIAVNEFDLAKVNYAS